MSDIRGAGFDGYQAQGNNEEQESNAGPSQTQNLPSLNIAAAEPFRLQNLGNYYPDTNSPETPEDHEDLSILAHYADPATLPQGVASPDGRTVQYGAVRVAAHRATEYQAVREHMIQGGQKAQKYLYTAEKERVGWDGVDVYPFHPDDESIVSHDGTHYIDKETKSGPTPDGNRMYVAFNTREGFYTESGGLQSAATGGAHEMAHVARQLAGGKDMPGWHTTEEHHIITKVENRVARVHGEAPRDTHSYAAKFRTNSITSKTPINSDTRRLLTDSRETLIRQTLAMEARGVGTVHEEEPEVLERDKTVNQVYDAVNSIEHFDPESDSDDE
jgi:hypothetical protein